MTMRNIVKIDEEKCNGCGDCIDACAEGAIKIIDGKAKLISEIYCDGLGSCLGECPQDAITIEERQAEDFDEDATEKHLEQTKKQDMPQESGCSCPGMMTQTLRENSSSACSEVVGVESQLNQWPVQLSLVSPVAPYFQGADLLLVADCVPFAMGDFHSKLLKGNPIAVGCPKLDDSQYYIDKLSEIIGGNNLSSLAVVHMIVPCCSGLTYIAREAIAKSGVGLDFQDITVSLQGEILQTENVAAG